MWLRFLVLLGFFLLVVSDDAAISIEDTLDDAEGDANDAGAWINAPDTGNQESAESEDDDRDLITGDDNDRDLNEEDDNDRDLNTEEDNDRDLNTEDDNDRDLNTGGDNGRDLNEEDDSDRNLNAEEDNDHDLNTGDDIDRDLNEEDANDRDLITDVDNDRELNTKDNNNYDPGEEDNIDRDLNAGISYRDPNEENNYGRDLKTEDNNNRNLNAGNDTDEHSDKNANDEDGHDRGGEQIQATTTLPDTKQTANRPAGVTSNKKGHVTKKKGKTSTESQRGKFINSKVNKTGFKSDKIVASNHTGIDPDLKSTREGTPRKKRLRPNSASPSIQLIILVVGAVLACVLITGFIRWRVRKRIKDKKLGKMADNLTVYRSRMALPKTSIMDTIYECECEDRVSALHAQSTDQALAEDDSLEGTKSMADELYCSHKFDNPHSIVSSRHYDADSYRSYSKSSKADREFDRVRGSKGKSTGHKRHHSHRGRYSRHHRRKHHDKTHSEKAESISPTNEASEEEHLDNISCLTSLLEQAHTAEAEKTVGNCDPVDTAVIPVDTDVIPVELKQTSPQQSRGIIGSMLNTWHSLSFNRDWVGRMWQEKHNVRRISDVLRNVRGSTSNTDCDESPPEEQTSNTDSDESPPEEQTSNTDSDESLPKEQTSDDVVPNQSNAATSSLEHTLLTTIPDVESGSGSESICLSNVDHPIYSTIETLFHSEEAPEISAEQSECREQSVSEIATTATACAVTETSLEAERSQMSRVGALPGFLSFSDYIEEPPEYESLLDSERFSNHSTPLSNIEHPRHHRRHRRKRTEGRERSNRHLYSRVQEVDSSHTDSQDPPTSHSREEHLPFKCDYKPHEIPTIVEPQSDDASTVTTPLCSSDTNEDTNTSHPVFTNSPSSHAVPPLAAPFVPQEGIVLEQLSDGAQIIYLPPPALPSYHNDTPPPYHK